jgi:hypothetical protein
MVIVDNIVALSSSVLTDTFISTATRFLSLDDRLDYIRSYSKGYVTD